MRATTLRTLLAALSAAAVVCADELSATSTVATTRDVDACRALGFDADVLDCRRCDELSTFLSDKLSGDDSNNKKKKKKAMHASQTLDADCRKCCTDLSALDLAAKNAQQYDRVVLEVCTCKFGRYPKVANFVHYHAEKHANLQIEVRTHCFAFAICLTGGADGGLVTKYVWLWSIACGSLCHKVHQCAPPVPDLLRRRGEQEGRDRVRQAYSPL